jgi:alpha-mannosidase
MAPGRAGKRRGGERDPDGGKPVLHLICNAHLDPVWQWRWEEGLAETLSTFKTALSMLDADPDLIFNHNEALLYDWVRIHDPGLFREIRERVGAGRWAVAGGWYLQPDVNLPGTESLFRQILYGRRFFSDYFDRYPLVAYNFDSFGHGTGLPQILLQAGFRMYIHMRPQPGELDLPAHLYRWRGLAGSTILCYRINIGLYHTEYGNLAERIDEGVRRVLEGGRDEALFWGIGDHGGGATAEDLEVIKDRIRSEDRIAIRHSTTEDFYRAVKAQEGSAPLFCGGLQPVFTGCYTSLARIKRRAQNNLGLLRQSEALAAAAWFLEGQAYPAAELDEAWKSHLFNDFHDILPGTCTRPAEGDALDLYGHSELLARRIRIKSMISLVGGGAGSAYLPLVIGHSQPGLTELPVEAECMISHRPKWSGSWFLKLFEGRREVPCQEEQAEALLPFNEWRRKVVFMAKLPPLGAAGYRLTLEKGKAWKEQNDPGDESPIHPCPGGLLLPSPEKGGGHHFRPEIKFLVVEDPGDSWGTDILSYRNVEGAFSLEPDSLRILHRGSVRRVTEARFFYGTSRLVLHILHYVSWPFLEMRLRIHWAEEGKRLKAAFPVPLDESLLTAEVPGGAVPIPSDGSEQVHGRWFLVRGKIRGKEWAFGAAHDAAPGLDFYRGEVRLSLLRSAAYCHEKGYDLTQGPAPQRMDLGLQHFRMALTTGPPGEASGRLPALADWLSAPPFALAHMPSGGAAISQSLLSVFPPNIRLLSCRRARDGEALLIRIQEASGRDTEWDLGSPAAGRKTRLRLGPFEIRTLRLDKKGFTETGALAD